MVNFDAIFFSQGVVDMCYWKYMVKKRGELAESMMAPFAIVGFLFIYALTCPTNYSEMGHLFFYPLYTDYTLQVFYVIGTWAWLTAIIWSMAYFANDKFKLKNCGANDILLKINFLSKIRILRLTISLNPMCTF